MSACTACGHAVEVHNLDRRCSGCRCLEYRQAPDDTVRYDVTQRVLGRNGATPQPVEAALDALRTAGIPLDAPMSRWRWDVLRVLQGKLEEDA